VKQFDRSTRLAEQIRRDLSVLLDGQWREELPGLVTFTHVKLSRDLRYATVYFSFLGPEAERPTALELLERERGRIRHEIGRGLRMRHVPEFTFKFDPSVEEGIKIERLLNEIHDGPKPTDE